MYYTNLHLKSGSKMGRSKATHALRYAEDLPLGQILIPTHKDGVWYYTNSHLKSGSKMGRSKAAHALRYAEDLPFGQILIPNHKDEIWYYN